MQTTQTVTSPLNEHNIKFTPKTNLGEIFANWCFYTGLLLIMFKFTGLGAFSTMSWAFVTLPWTLPIISFGGIVILAIIVTIITRLTRAATVIEVQHED